MFKKDVLLQVSWKDFFIGECGPEHTFPTFFFFFNVVPNSARGIVNNILTYLGMYYGNLYLFFRILYFYLKKVLNL